MNAQKIKRFVRGVVVKWLIVFFTNAIKSALTWENVMALQDECKHEGQEGVFCNKCGKQLQSEDQTILESALENVLRKHGMIKDKPAAPAAKKNLADRLLGKDKK